jgi:hypothetical protein
LSAQRGHGKARIRMATVPEIEFAVMYVVPQV